MFEVFSRRILHKISLDRIVNIYALTDLVFKSFTPFYFLLIASIIVTSVSKGYFLNKILVLKSRSNLIKRVFLINLIGELDLQREISKFGSVLVEHKFSSIAHFNHCYPAAYLSTVC